MNDLKNKKITFRSSRPLYIGFSIIIALVLIFSTMSYSFVGNLQKDMELVVQKNILKIQLAAKYETSRISGLCYCLKC